MLCDYLLQAGAMCVVMRNDVLTEKEIDEIKPDAVVISPGPGRPADAGLLMTVLPFIVQSYPVLGVCLGHQAIGEFCGAELGLATAPKHGKVDTIYCSNRQLFDGMNEFSATRYHSLILTKLVDSLEMQAWTRDNEVMAIKHKSLPVWGIQFHPESCLTKDGMKIIQNFLKEVKTLASV
jgi:anthranilate synthase/aminodeoxychorismate synthase-like glutamine amidotransferase